MRVSLQKILFLLGLLISQSLAAAPARPVAPETAPDINPDPDVVEVVLVAYEDYVDFGTGNATKVWTYNGGIPGPTIRGKLGDTLIVHFYNELPEETTIHWHGMEVPANMDGSHIAQLPVPPGGYFRYEFRLLHASLFWYHPHIRTNVQVEKGLYGALLVEDPEENRELGLPEYEHILVLDDILLDPDGRVAEPFPADPLENAATQLNGREGNVLLVNGVTEPLAKIRRGRPHRLRIVNTANARFMRLSIPGHTLYRIGGDGGLLESPLAVEPVEQVPDSGNGHMDGMAAAPPDSHDEEMSMISDPDLSKGILLTPGERADIVFTPHGKGPLSLEWHDVARGRHRTFYKDDDSIGIGHAHDDGKRPPQVLMRFKLIANDSKDDYLPPDPLRVIEAIDVADAGILTSMFGHGAPDESGDVTFFVQMKPDGGGMMPLPFDKVTPEDAYTVTIGENGIWEVHNMTGGMHNFHTHGFSFQLLETQFVDMDNPDNNYTEAAPYQEIKDTILLPARPGAGGRSRTIVRLAASFDDTGREEDELAASGKEPTAETSGGWLFHCHLLEHSARGMMSFFQTAYPD